MSISVQGMVVCITAYVSFCMFVLCNVVFGARHRVKNAVVGVTVGVAVGIVYGIRRRATTVDEKTRADQACGLTLASLVVGCVCVFAHQWWTTGVAFHTRGSVRDLVQQPLAHVGLQQQQQQREQEHAEPRQRPRRRQQPQPLPQYARLHRFEAAEALAMETRQYILELQEDAPPDFCPPVQVCCPITLAVLLDPVQTKYGHVFEREALERWLQLCGEDGCCPITRRPLSVLEVEPALGVQVAIRDWILAASRKLAGQQRAEQIAREAAEKEAEEEAEERRMRRNARNRQKRAAAKRRKLDYDMGPAAAGHKKRRSRPLKE